MTTPNQPTIPAQQETDIEQVFIAESPPGLWPSNSDSNFGAFRRVVCGPLNNVIELLNELFSELFTFTAVDYLGRWEEQLGLPINPPASLGYRRIFVNNRIKVGMFTRKRRQDLVEDFIRATFGDALEFHPDGIALVEEGLPMYSGVYDISNTYTITEDIEDFSFVINIIPGADVNEEFFTREMNHIVPSGISWTITRDPL